MLFLIGALKFLYVIVVFKKVLVERRVRGLGGELKISIGVCKIG